MIEANVRKYPSCELLVAAALLAPLKDPGTQ